MLGVGVGEKLKMKKSWFPPSKNSRADKQTLMLLECLPETPGAPGGRSTEEVTELWGEQWEW